MATRWRVYFGVLAAGTLITAAFVMIFLRNNPQEIGIKGFPWGDDAALHQQLGLKEIFSSRWIAVGALGIAACTFAISGTAT